MINLNNNTLMLGTSEFRMEIPKIVKEIKLKKIILTKRGKPIAILQDFEEYEAKEKLIEEYEDLILGNLAKEREQKSKSTDYITHEEVLNKLGLL
ncbi:MAG: type II toxin-antitoxin system prevent-host-death family antitoxin [Candidatus Gracilibacteria bacterium]|jgi:prevent-host-death family protein